jgi:peptidoglycan hydrolase-like protein with peptidoglycan-binding domain
MNPLVDICAGMANGLPLPSRPARPARLATSVIQGSLKWFTVVVVLASVSGIPAEAKNKIVTDSPIADIASGQPMTIVISLGAQKVDIYRSTSLVASSQVSSGKPGYATPAGVYSILEKQKWHESNIYSGAPMPWMQRITWSGMALHGGVVPGYPASHGCVRLYPSFASKLFEITNVGANVVIAHDRPAPTLIEHPNLFQPLSPPTAAKSPPTAARADPYLQAQSNGSSLPANAAGLMGRAEAMSGDVTASRESVDPQVANQVDAGAKAAAIQAAEPRSNAPLRILVTRQTQRDRIIGVQNLLAALGYLEPQNFDGTLGKPTIAAIKAFQKANGLKETGGFTDDLVKKVYAAGGKSEPSAGHLFIRQAFKRVFDAPVSFKNANQPLGTHVYSAMTFAPGDTTTQWMAITIDGADAASTLDRIEIPADIHQKISERLTPGSTLIIADTSINSASLPSGGDFLVLAKDNTTGVAKGITDQPTEAPFRTTPRPMFRHYYRYRPWFQRPRLFSPW